MVFFTTNQIDIYLYIYIFTILKRSQEGEDAGHSGTLRLEVPRKTAVVFSGRFQQQISTTTVVSTIDGDFI